jgi:hypothetical protein
VTGLADTSPSRSFARYAAIDWSGAKGARHPGIALAVCSSGNEAPTLVAPSGRYWSRTDIMDWLLQQDDALLVGMDFSFAPPFVARRSYLPGETLPTDAKAFWAHVDRACDDEDLGAASFVETHYRSHFYLGAADGVKSDYMHLRRCEARYNDGGGGKPSTIFDAIGAAQVSKASFAGMRLLHRLGGKIPVWPFDPRPQTGSLLVEIYTQIAARAAGLPKGRSKVRTPDDLDKALSTLGCKPHIPLTRYSDHATDAILTAAWLRTHAGNPDLWAPAAMNREIAATEGWTFGVM